MEKIDKERMYNIWRTNPCYPHDTLGCLRCWPELHPGYERWRQQQILLGDYTAAEYKDHFILTFVVPLGLLALVLWLLS